MDLFTFNAQHDKQSHTCLVSMTTGQRTGSLTSAVVLYPTMTIDQQNPVSGQGVSKNTVIIIVIIIIFLFHYRIKLEINASTLILPYPPVSSPKIMLY